MIRKQQISPLQVRVIFDTNEDLTDFLENSPGVVVGTDFNTPLNPQPQQKEIDYGTV